MYEILSYPHVWFQIASCKLYLLVAFLSSRCVLFLFTTDHHSLSPWNIFSCCTSWGAERKNSNENKSNHFRRKAVSTKILALVQWYPLAWSYYFLLLTEGCIKATINISNVALVIDSPLFVCGNLSSVLGTKRWRDWSSRYPCLSTLFCTSETDALHRDFVHSQFPSIVLGNRGIPPFR